MWRNILLGLLAFCVIPLSPTAEAHEQGGWVRLFDGKTMKGWKASESADSFRIDDDDGDGAIVAQGAPKGHLFYVGEDGKASFTNFELKIDVRTTPGANGGIYFHTRFQEEGWPDYGFEVQVNNTHRDPRKSGGLYQVQDVSEAPAKDNKWYTTHIIVRGKRVIVKVDGKQLVDWTKPENWKELGKQIGVGPERRIQPGTFALQAHDPKSVVRYKNIRVKPLP